MFVLLFLVYPFRILGQHLRSVISLGYVRSCLLAKSIAQPSYGNKSVQAHMLDIQQHLDIGTFTGIIDLVLLWLAMLRNPCMRMKPAVTYEWPTGLKMSKIVRLTLSV